MESLEQLPRGWRDEQEAGHYRVVNTDSEALFAFNLGPDSWKRWFYPATETIQVAEKTPEGFRFRAPDTPRRKLALLGARSCELQAIAIQDRVFIEGEFGDPAYASRRRDCLIIAVQCGQASSSCFCSSMNTGPTASSGFDLALTEVNDENGHRFLVQTGSEAGRDLLQQISHTQADATLTEGAGKAWQRAQDQMGRSLNTDGLKEALQDGLTLDAWQRPAERCLSCGNCTMVCPTCFCSSVEEQPALDANSSSTVRHWASCFEEEFSYIAGGSVRQSTRSRYRQWLTHKLSTWHDQFGSSGCVGCGRCISWCPTGIDITQEAQALRDALEEQQP